MEIIDNQLEVCRKWIDLAWKAKQAHRQAFEARKLADEANHAWELALRLEQDQWREVEKMR